MSVLTRENRYKHKAYDDMKVRVPKGVRARFAAACEENGDTMNHVLNECIREYLGVPREDWTYKFFAEIDKRPI